MLPKSWKKSFNNGSFIPSKMRFYNECNYEMICDRCNNQNSENKEIEADINKKRQIPNQFG